MAHTDDERRAVLRSIGPVWDGNEVWLLAAGGTLYFAFPALYASSFSGFYLPLMIVLWLLILRGIAIEFRNHIEQPGRGSLSGTSCSPARARCSRSSSAPRWGTWSAACPSTAPAISSFRCGPISRAGPEAGILDWYTVLVAIAALLILTIHGALWLALKNRGALHARARALASIVWWAVLAAVIAITLVSFRVQPHLQRSFDARPWAYAFPLTALVGLFGMKIMNAAGRAMNAFLSSCVFILGMLTSVAAGLYPYVLPSSTDPALSLTIYNTAAARYGLEIGLIWFIPGMLLTSAYFVYTYRSFAGKV